MKKVSYKVKNPYQQALDLKLYRDILFTHLQLKTLLAEPVAGLTKRLTAKKWLLIL